MESSSYKVVLTSDATRGSTRYLQHYGVKGMKWGVVHDEVEKKRRARIALDKPESPTGPYKSKLESDRDEANRTGFTIERTRRTPYGDIVVQTQPSNKPDYKKIFNEAAAEIDLKERIAEGAREGFKENVAQSVEDYKEDVNFLQDVIIDELEERNPVIGQAARAVDDFLDGIDSFISDFVKSANKIVGDIISWGKKLFGG